MRRNRHDLAKSGGRPHPAVRAAIAAASLVVAACFGAAISFAQTSAETATAPREAGIR